MPEKKENVDVGFEDKKEIMDNSVNIEVDLENYTKYPVVDPNKRYKIKDEPKDVRGEIKVDPKINLNDYSGPFKPDLRMTDFTREELARMYLMVHEYFLLCIEAWGKEVAVRYGLDAMLEIQNSIWGAGVLEETKNIKRNWMKIQGHNVEAFMKDIQVDNTGMYGKYFECSFEYDPKEDVGTLTYMKCKAATQWEELGRPDILEKTCHMICPPSLIETAKYYNPNMKIEVLAIPPRKSKDDVCCKFRLSMRKPSDPDYVKVDY